MKMNFYMFIYCVCPLFSNLYCFEQLLQADKQLLRSAGKTFMNCLSVVKKKPFKEIIWQEYTSYEHLIFMNLYQCTQTVGINLSLDDLQRTFLQNIHKEYADTLLIHSSETMFY